MTDLHHPDSAQQWTDRLVAVLRRRAGRHLAEAEIEAGVRPGYLRKAQSASGNVMLRKFLAICEAADIDPGDVFHEVFPKSDLDPDFGLPVPNIPLPKIAKQAQRRAGQEPQRPAVGTDWLEWLDTLRYDDPRRAIQAAEAAVDSVEPGHLTWLLGIWASACRFRGLNAPSLLGLREAVRIARAESDIFAEADLMLRGASLVASQSGNYSAALKFAEKAGALFARIGELSGLADALVKQATYLFYQEKLAESQKAISSAFRLMKTENSRSRVVANQILGQIALWEQDLDVAALHTQKALSMASGTYEKAKLRWQVGSIFIEKERFVLADQAFEMATESLLSISPIDAALCACDHVRLLFSKHRIVEARAKAKAMRRLLSPLSGNLIASSAIRDLILNEQEDSLQNIKMTVRIIKRIEQSRRATARRSGLLLT